MSTKTTTPITSTLEIANLPNGLTPEDCQQAAGQRCTFTSYPDTLTSYPVRNLTVSTILQKEAPQISGQHFLGGLFVIQFAGPTLTWNANGLQVEARLPVISFLPLADLIGYKYYKGPPFAPSSPDFRIDYYIPNPAGYDWGGGPEPTVVPDSYLDGKLVPGYAEWTEQLGVLTASISVNGTNNSTAEWDSFRTFAAGALVGVAGGALVGALQEAMHRKDEIAPPLNAPSSEE
jgi:hypothetical protein